MKNNHASSYMINKLGGIILALIFIFFSASLLYSNFSKSNERAEDYVDSIIDLRTKDDLLDIDTSTIPIPVLDYAEILTKELFSFPKSKSEQYVKKISFVTPFTKYLDDPEVYGNYEIRFKEYKNVGVPGITVTILNKYTRQEFKYLDCDDVEYLQHKKICILPGIDKSPSINKAFNIDREVVIKSGLTTTKVDITQVQSDADIIKEGQLSELTISFEKRESGYSSHVMVASSPYIVKKFLFKFKSQFDKLPIYAHDNTVCFLQTDFVGGKSTVRFNTKTNTYEGHGPYKWSILDHIYNDFNKE